VYEDPSTELRLAFAERDEEIRIKDKSLMERSTEVLILEESLCALYAQLRASGITPCRPLTEFASRTLCAQQEAQQLVIHKQSSRAYLEERIRRIDNDVRALDRELKVLEIQLEQEEEDQIVGKDHHGRVATLLEEIIMLKSRKEKMISAREIADAECAANENEVDLLRKVVQNSTKALVEMQAVKDSTIGLEVIEMLKRHFLAPRTVQK
jgi:hypothetical protein